VGLLLAPQGIGAALALPLAGRLTDKIGARSVISAGIVIAALGTVAYTQLGAGTPYLFLAVALLVTGMGIGATIAPSMAAAFQAVTRAETPRATSALNVIQRVSGAIGTAVFAIILQDSITARSAGSPGGIAAITALSRPSRAHAASALAAAFGTTFWVAVALIATALIPALLLPRSRAEDPASAAAQRRS
jgi:MFS family permease